MLTIKRSDIFAERADIRVNAVNTVGVMGAGVARAFRLRYPYMYYTYKLACDYGDLQIGSLHVYHADDCTIVNFPTKKHWRNPSSYSYIAAALPQLAAVIRQYAEEIKPSPRVVVPALGCGNGGLDWSVVRSMIESELSSLPADIVVLEPLHK